MRPERPTDASGDGFRQALVHIRTIRPSDGVPLRRDEAQIIWDEEAMPPNCPAVREATAVLGDYFVDVGSEGPSVRKRTVRNENTGRIR